MQYKGNLDEDEISGYIIKMCTKTQTSVNYLGRSILTIEQDNFH